MSENTVRGASSKKKLIEVALPLDAINAASAKEKSLRHGHPSTLHLWWARRPLAACRAVLFASLVDDPSSDPERFPTLKAQEDERRRLFGIIQELVQWENSTSERVLKLAHEEILRSTDGNPPRILDPFCGGGSIPLEAQRLGLTAIASDLNPVPVLITRALVDIPARFAGRRPVNSQAQSGVSVTGAWKGAAGLAEDVRSYGTWMRSVAERRIGHLYPRASLPADQGGGEATVIAWLWARTVKCPNPACGTMTPLLTSFVLSSKPGRETYLIPDPRLGQVTFSIGSRPPKVSRDPKTGYKRGMSGIFECAVCGTVTTRDYVAAEGAAGRMGAVQTAVVCEGNGGRTYLGPEASPTPKNLVVPPLPELDAELAPNPRDVWCRNFGLTTPRHLFTDRQLIALSTFGDLVLEARARVKRDAVAAGLPDDDVRLTDGGVGSEAYADAVATYLAFAVSKSADFWSSLATWSSAPKNELVVATFRRQALPMTWDFGEVNVFSESGGNFAKSLNSVVEVVSTLGRGPLPQVGQLDATALPDVSGSVMVSTDPPYYDNIGYADLSDFFYVWLRRSLSTVHPDLFRTVLTPKADELVAIPYRFGGDRAKAENHFETGLSDVFRRIRATTDASLPLTIYYAFKQTEAAGAGEDGPAAMASTGWETMLEALLSAGFSIGGTWPMRTERSSRSVSIGTNALASSIVLVCRPRPVMAGITDRRGLLSELKATLPNAVRSLQHGNIAPVDLAQAAIGPGMAVFSRYSKVVEPDGAPMTVRTALGLINTVLGEVLAQQEDEFDADTRWAVTWYEQYRHEASDYDQAMVLARARGVGMNGLEAAGIVSSIAGKTRLLARSELDPTWDPRTDKRLTVWEVTQYLIRALDDGGEPAAADLVRRVGGLGETARDLAYRLYSICERKKWADEALSYNALVTAWPEITRLAASTPGNEAPHQTQLFS
jgi:putative DNA methylase